MFQATTQKVKNMMGTIIASTILVILNSGCASNFGKVTTLETDMIIPNSWHAESSDHKRKNTTFRIDEELNEYLKKALEKNYSLRSMTMSLARASAMHKVAISEKYPQLEAGFNGSHGETRLNKDDNIVARSYEPWGSVSWEIDLWGKIRDKTSASESEYKASQADHRAAYLSLSSQIVKAWYQAVTDKVLLSHATEVATSYQITLEAVEEQYYAGLTEGLEVYMAETAVSQALTSLQTNKAIGDSSIRYLQVLSGDYPDGVLKLPKAFPAQPQKLPPGIPADMVEKRPDLVAAQARITAADHQWSVAIKSQLPTISLSGRTGISSKDFGNALNPTFGFWQLTAGLVQPIFDGGRLKSLADEAEFTVKEQQLSYCHLLLTAFKEVEDSLGKELLLQEQYKHAQNTVNAAKQSWKAAVERYHSGSTDLLTVLLTQRQYLESKREIVILQNDMMQNAVDLTLALGEDLTDGTYTTRKEAK